MQANLYLVVWYYYAPIQAGDSSIELPLLRIA